MTDRRTQARPHWRPPVRAAFAIPGDIGAPTGGYAYARRLLALVHEHGVNLTHVHLPEGYPDPTPEEIAGTAASIADLPGETVLLIDGLAFGAMPATLIAEFRRPVVALVHHPLGLETGLAPDRRDSLIRCEREALALAARVIATSPATSRTLREDFGVRDEILRIAEPGTDPAPFAHGALAGEPPHLLAVGAVSPRKGYDILIAALEGLADLPWRLTIAGAIWRDPDTVLRLEAQLRAANLAGRVTLAGEVDADTLEALYRGSDLFVSASLYEGYGMVLAEAMAHGLPIVASTGGAAGDTVADDAALKVPPGDVAALRDALDACLSSPGLRATLAAGARAAASRLPRWEDTARIVAQTIKEVAP